MSTRGRINTVPGLMTRSELWEAWKAVRKALRQATLRDVTDFVEYDIDPEVWIQRLMRDLQAGTYEPSRPVIFRIAKSQGFSRRMTQPAIPDVVLYRALVDAIYKKARRREGKHVYFERADRARLQAAVDREAGAYPTLSQRRFEAWLRYHQYRKQLIFAKAYPLILLTDISNYFDSVLYGRVADALLGLSVGPRKVGLLFFLLERLSFRDAYSESPRIGLPVDEFDCSRKLAHLVLFPHDRRMAGIVGQDAYVRWMDDQNVGVDSRRRGLAVVAAIGDSLGSLHLTANAGKTRLLELAEARDHFHLRFNDILDDLDRLPHGTRQEQAHLRRRLVPAWRDNLASEHKGEWQKVLKRVYRLAALGRSRVLRRRAIRDLLRYPTLSRRIVDYVRVTGTPGEYLRWAEEVWSSDEQPYGDVTLVLLEGLLRVRPERSLRASTTQLAARLVLRQWPQVGWRECSALAPLLLLRFGDRRSMRRLQTLIESPDEFPDAAVKAAAVVLASDGPDQLARVRSVAARLLRNPLSEVIRFIERLQALTSVPDRFKARLDTFFDPVEGGSFVDTRTIVVARLLSLNGNQRVRAWLRDRSAYLGARLASEAERELLVRLVRVP